MSLKLSKSISQQQSKKHKIVSLWGLTCFLFAVCPSAFSQPNSILKAATGTTKITEVVPEINLPFEKIFDKVDSKVTIKIPTMARRVLEAPPSLFPLEIRTEAIRLSPSPQILRERLNTLVDSPSLGESITLRLNTGESGAIIEQLAKRSLSEKLFSREASRIKNDFKRHVLSKTKGNKLELSAKDLRWIDLGKLSSTLAQASISPSISGSELWQALNDPTKLPQLQSFFQQSGRENFEKLRVAGPQLLQGKRILWEEFLPPHLQKQLGKFSPYRGRNCFATALNFHDARAEKLENINLIREEGHHPSLINNDEFLEALWLGYHELSAVEILEGLQFGDLVVFYDPTEGENSFSAFKHAMVHIGGEIYFQKPSKSASSPIEFTFWSDMADIWVKIIPQIDYRVFRRVPNGDLKGQNRISAIEKIPWTN